MLISWDWLKQYVPLDVSDEEFARRLLLAGLNHESTQTVGADIAIDLEVTSNRPDCLGHIGIAREAAVLFGQPLTLPKAAPIVGNTRVDSLAKVRIDCTDLCPHYTARVIRGIKIKSSPAWLVNRLTTVGQPSINNVVDITNYVLLECGQPLHAFDLAKLAGHEIVVRRGRKGEKLEAIDHHSYELTESMCVIADRDRAVAIAGIMGGATTEVTAATLDVLVESARFDPLNVRTTSRQLGLRSDSSYRFERGVDPQGVEWASRRCCELILDLAGGELAAGVIDVGTMPATPPTIVLRLEQLPRILGITIDRGRVLDILKSLGNDVLRDEPQRIEVRAPSWRRDLEREIDLIEEVARIHGYDEISENVSVPMAPSARSLEDRVLGEVRQTLTSHGYDEAMTISVVEPEWSEVFSPWSSEAPLHTQIPILRRATCLRRSLVPSLLAARRTNETLANPVIELFEIAKIYLARAGQLPDERRVLGLTSGDGFYVVKGVIEALAERLHIREELSLVETTHELFDRNHCGELRLGNERLGWIGEVSKTGRQKFELRGAATVAELDLAVLIAAAQLVPKYAPISAFPAIERDVNLVVDESVAWAQLAAEVRAHCSIPLERLTYRDTYRDAQRLGSGKKSLLFTVTMRGVDGTLTSQQADDQRARIVAACQAKFGAVLRALSR